MHEKNGEGLKDVHLAVLMHTDASLAKSRASSAEYGREDSAKQWAKNISVTIWHTTVPKLQSTDSSSFLDPLQRTLHHIFTPYMLSESHIQSKTKQLVSDLDDTLQKELLTSSFRKTKDAEQALHSIKSIKDELTAWSSVRSKDENAQSYVDILTPLSDQWSSVA